MPARRRPGPHRATAFRRTRTTSGRAPSAPAYPPRTIRSPSATTSPGPPRRHRRLPLPQIRPGRTSSGRTSSGRAAPSPRDPHRTGRTAHRRSCPRTPPLRAPPRALPLRPPGLEALMRRPAPRPPAAPSPPARPRPKIQPPPPPVPRPRSGPRQLPPRVVRRPRQTSRLPPVRCLLRGRRRFRGQPPSRARHPWFARRLCPCPRPGILPALRPYPALHMFRVPRIFPALCLHPALRLCPILCLCPTLCLVARMFRALCPCPAPRTPLCLCPVRVFSRSVPVPAVTPVQASETMGQIRTGSPLRPHSSPATTPPVTEPAFSLDRTTPRRREGRRRSVSVSRTGPAAPSRRPPSPARRRRSRATTIPPRARPETARPSTASLETASLETARPSTASLETASLETARPSTASLGTASLGTARPSTARSVMPSPATRPGMASPVIPADPCPADPCPVGLATTRVPSRAVSATTASVRKAPGRIPLPRRSAARRVRTSGPTVRSANSGIRARLATSSTRSAARQRPLRCPGAGPLGP